MGAGPDPPRGKPEERGILTGRIARVRRPHWTAAVQAVAEGGILLLLIGGFAGRTVWGGLREDDLAAPPNNTCGTAARIALGTIVTGTTRLAGDDYRLSGTACFTTNGAIGNNPSEAAGRDVVYAFTAPHAGLYSFRLVPLDPDADLVLYTSDSCPLGPTPAVLTHCLQAANRNGAGSSSGAEEVLCQPMSSGERTFVYVDAEKPDYPGGSFTLEAMRCVREIENNDKPSLAAPLACPVEGSIGSRGDVDFFSLGTPEPLARVFALLDGAGASSSDFDLRVTTATDTLEYDDGNNGVQFGDLSANVAGTRVPAAPGPVYLRVNLRSDSTMAEPYRLYAVVQPPDASATPEQEPNDTIAQANMLGGDYRRGTLASLSDVDLFGFCAAAGEMIVLGLDEDPGYNGSPIGASLALLDSAGTNLLSVDNGAHEASTRAPVTGKLDAESPVAPGQALAYRARETGLYYSMVSPSRAPTEDENYLLSVSLDCRVPQSDLQVAVAADSDHVAAGGAVVYQVDLRNTGPSTATQIALTATWDRPVADMEGLIPWGWDCLPASIGPNPGLTCTRSCLPFNGARTDIFSFLVRVPECTGAEVVGTTVTVSAITDDPDPGTNTSSVQVAVVDPGTCDDGDPCTEGDICIGGRCLGSPALLPAEVNDTLTVSALGTVAIVGWADPPGPFSLYRGLRHGTGTWLYDHLCVEKGTTGPVFDATMPATGEVLYYLVARDGVCGESIPGRDGGGTPIPAGPPCN